MILMLPVHAYYAIFSLAHIASAIVTTKFVDTMLGLAHTTYIAAELLAFSKASNQSPRTRGDQQTNTDVQ